MFCCNCRCEVSVPHQCPQYVQSNELLEKIETPIAVRHVKYQKLGVFSSSSLRVAIPEETS